MLLRIRIALAFLTILPLRLPGRLTEPDLAGSMAFFPLAGWVIGGLLAGAAWVFSLLAVPALPAAVAVVALQAWFTRALHLDGLADLIDALGGGNTPERRLAIMKDSAIGAFGVVGLICLLLLKASCIFLLLDRQMAWEHYLMLAGVPALSRWAMTALAYKMKYPRQTGTGHPFVGKVAFGSLMIGAFTCLPVFLLQGAGAGMIAASLAPSLWLRNKAEKALGGITGDVLGAACELGEGAGLFMVLLFL